MASLGGVLDSANQTTRSFSKRRSRFFPITWDWGGLTQGLGRSPGQARAWIDGLEARNTSAARRGRARAMGKVDWEGMSTSRPSIESGAVASFHSPWERTKTWPSRTNGMAIVVLHSLLTNILMPASHHGRAVSWNTYVARYLITHSSTRRRADMTRHVRARLGAL